MRFRVFGFGFLVSSLVFRVLLLEFRIWNLGLGFSCLAESYKL